MNIGLFADTWLPNTNGVVNSMLTLEHELEKRGHSVYIFAPSTSVPEAGRDNLFTVPSLRFVFSKEHRVAMTLSPALFKKIDELNLDVIHTNSEMSLFTFAKSAAKRKNIPLVHTYHTMWEDYTHYLPVNPEAKPVKQFVRSMMARCGDFASAVITPTAKTYRYVVDCCAQKPEKITIIPTGIHLERFDRSRLDPSEIQGVREKYGLVGGHTAIFVGRLGEEKNIPALIRGAAALRSEFPDFRLLIVGPGPEEEKLKALVKELSLGDTVIFTGSVPFEKVGVYYNACDLFVNASTSETQGLTYIEAMASGIPVLAKADESVNGLIDDGVNSALFARDEDFPVKAAELLRNPEKMREMGARAVAAADKYTPEAFCDAVLNVYENVAKKDPNA